MLVQHFWLQTPKFQLFQVVRDLVHGTSHLHRNAGYLHFPPISIANGAPGHLSRSQSSPGCSSNASSNRSHRISAVSPAAAAPGADAGQDRGCHTQPRSAAGPGTLSPSCVTPSGLAFTAARKVPCIQGFN